MAFSIVFVEDRDIDYVKVASSWAKDQGIAFYSFSTATEFMAWFENRKDVMSLFVIIDFFLPDLQGTDLIFYLLKAGISPLSIVLTSISENVIGTVKRYFGILGGIHKKGIQSFKEELKAYYHSFIRNQSAQLIKVKEDVYIDLRYGVIYDLKRNIFKTLTKKELAFISKLVMQSRGRIVGYIFGGENKNIVVWRLNKKLEQFKLKILRSKVESRYILVYL